MTSETDALIWQSRRAGVWRTSRLWNASISTHVAPLRAFHFRQWNCVSIAENKESRSALFKDAWKVSGVKMQQKCALQFCRMHWKYFTSMQGDGCSGKGWKFQACVDRQQTLMETGKDGEVKQLKKKVHRCLSFHFGCTQAQTEVDKVFTKFRTKLVWLKIFVSRIPSKKCMKGNFNAEKEGKM